MEDDTLKDIAVVGRRDFCLGFRLAGVTETHEVGKDGFEETFRQVLEDDLGIVIVHQDDLNRLDRQTRMEVQNSVNPVVVALSKEGESEDLRAKIKKAIGVDIWG